MSELLSTALRYLEAGFSLFPLDYKSKHPRFDLLPRNESDTATWKPFITTSPTEEQVKEWFTDRRLNIGLIMGQVSGNVIALDFDQITAYDQWIERFPSIAATTATATTGKGMHVLLRLPPPIPGNWKIILDGQHIGECRGEGGYIAVYPSIHPNGNLYEWVTPPWENIVRVDSLAEVGISRVVGAENGFTQGENAPNNGKHPLPPRTQNFMVNGTVVGRGVNDELFNAAIQHAAAGYSSAETVSILGPVAERWYIGQGPGNTAEQALRTIKSGYRRGQSKEPISLRPARPGTPAWLGPKPGLGPKSPDDTAPGSPKVDGLGPIPRLSDDPDEPSPNDDQGFRPKYILKEGVMTYVSYQKDGDGFKAVLHPFYFWGRISQKMTIYHEDGQQEAVYTIVGQKAKRPFVIDVTAEDFADGRKLYKQLLNYLPGGPPPIKDSLVKQVNTAIAAISERKVITEINATPSTGWTPDGSAFVTPGGCIGQSDYICRLDEGLASEMKHFRFRENTPAENKEAVKLLFDLRDIYRPASMNVILAHTFLPPLLRWVGNRGRYLLHIHAGTGSLKSELAKLMMAFYGPTGDYAITYKWTDTPNGVDSRANALKDCLMLIDDLKPNTIRPDHQGQWVAFVQSYVDAMGKKRSTISGGANSGRNPRCILISTGEAIPEAGEASYIARMLLVQLDKQPEGWNDQLGDIQERIEKGVNIFSGLMGDFIGWLLEGDNGKQAAEIFKSFQVDSMGTEHLRLSNNYSANRTAAKMLAEFCYQRGYISELERNVFLVEHHESIMEILAHTGEKVKSERYSQRFIAALRDAVSTGFAYIADAKPDARRVGWEDGDFVYLTNGSLTIANQWLRNANQPAINMSSRELREQLYQDGLTDSTPGRVQRGEYDVQRVDPADNSKPMVMAVFRAEFYNLDDTEISKPEKGP